MANSTNIIFINFPPDYRRRIQAPKPKDSSFTVECAASNGKGMIPDPNGIFPPQDCSACRGTGWITLNGLPGGYRRCGRCSGKGILDNAISGWKICDICKGSGLVKVR